MWSTQCHPFQRSRNTGIYFKRQLPFSVILVLLSCTHWKNSFCSVGDYRIWCAGLFLKPPSRMMLLPHWGWWLGSLTFPFIISPFGHTGTIAIVCVREFEILYRRFVIISKGNYNMASEQLNIKKTWSSRMCSKRKQRSSWSLHKIYHLLSSPQFLLFLPLLVFYMTPNLHHFLRKYCP